MDWKVFVNQDRRLSGMFRQVRRKPAWPIMAALACGALVVVVPVVMALLAGLVVGVVVYAIGSVIAGIGGWFVGLGGSRRELANEGEVPGDELRDNVRVVQR